MKRADLFGGRLPARARALVGGGVVAVLKEGDMGLVEGWVHSHNHTRAPRAG